MSSDQVRHLRPVAAGHDQEPMPQGRNVVAVIGIDNYQHWPLLSNAVSDARGIRKLFVETFGFSEPAPHLFDAAATKEAITDMVEYQLRSELKPDDSLILFFAGHGHTRVDQVGDREVETGYIVPVEARTGRTERRERWGDYVEIDSFLEAVGKLPARQVLVILDACHSGFALGKAMRFRSSVESYRQDLVGRVGRKVITSARRDQRALDGGPIHGHSLFTGILIDGLNRGDADTDDNGLVTSSELGLFVQQGVRSWSESKQTPAFGDFHLDDRGKLVISLPGKHAPPVSPPRLGDEPIIQPSPVPKVKRFFKEHPLVLPLAGVLLVTLLALSWLATRKPGLSPTEVEGTLQAIYAVLTANTREQATADAVKAVTGTAVANAPAAMQTAAATQVLATARAFSAREAMLWATIQVLRSQAALTPTLTATPIPTPTSVPTNTPKPISTTPAPVPASLEPTPEPPALITQVFMVATGIDDAEEIRYNGSLYTSSSDLELFVDQDQSRDAQLVGIRFSGVTIPKGADIINAYIEFEAKDQVESWEKPLLSQRVILTVQGEIFDNGHPFAQPFNENEPNNILNRARTDASYE